MEFEIGKTYINQLSKNVTFCITKKSETKITGSLRTAIDGKNVFRIETYPIIVKKDVECVLYGNSVMYSADKYLIKE